MKQLWVKMEFLFSLMQLQDTMLKAYKVDDKGEPPAYTIGFIVMKMLESKIFKNG